MRLLLLLLTLAIVGCSQPPPQGTAATPQTTAPEKAFALADFKAALTAGKPVFLEVGAPW